MPFRKIMSDIIKRNTIPQTIHDAEKEKMYQQGYSDGWDDAIIRVKEIMHEIWNVDSKEDNKNA